MKKSLRSGVIMVALAAMVLSFAGAALAQKPDGPAKWTDVPPDAVTGGPAPHQNPSAPTATLVFYTDRAVFQADNPGLTFEDFSATNVPPNSVGSCPGPFNSATNNACFSTGAIVDGISLDSTPSSDNVVLTPPFLGVTCVAVGPNFFADDAELTFTGPDDVFAFGADIWGPFGPVPVDISIYGASGLLGTDSFVGGNPGAFWGVASDEAITRIEVVDPGDLGELFCDVEFGGTGVPTTPPLGLLLLVAVLVGVSAFVVFRHHA